MRRKFPTCEDSGCPFPDHHEMCVIHHCPHCTDGYVYTLADIEAAFREAIGWTAVKDVTQADIDEAWLVYRKTLEAEK